MKYNEIEQSYYTYSNKSGHLVFHIICILYFIGPEVLWENDYDCLLLTILNENKTNVALGTNDEWGFNLLKVFGVLLYFI